MSIALRPKHIIGELVPCRWDLQPIYTMLDTGIWDDECREKLSSVLADDQAIDGFTLMLYGSHFMTERKTVEKMCSYDVFTDRIRTRLASPSIGNTHESVQLALKKAVNRDW